MKQQIIIAMAALVAAPVFAQREGGQTPGRETTTLSAQTPQHIRASNLIGARMQSKDGGNLGEVEDVLFNPQTGQINFVVLGKGGFLGIGEKLVPVPWQAVNVRSEKEFVVNVDQQKLRAAPMFESQQHAELNKPDVILRVYRFYEIEPTGVGAPGTEGGRERGTLKNPQGKQD